MSRKSSTTHASGSIRSKLQILATASVSIALVLSCSMFLAHGVMALREARRNTIEAQASLLAFNCAAAVEFGDSVQADRLLNALRREPTVVAAALFDGASMRVGAYRKDESVASKDWETGATPHGHQIYREEIKSDGDVVGEMRLLVDTGSVQSSIRRFLTLACLVAIGAWIVAVAVATVLQRGITQPVRKLADVARSVTRDHDYSLRVETQAEGELRELVDAFNDMLTQVETSKRDLEDARQTLELRVEERTAQLARACDAAEAASRAKSDFLANMSHEIRTPLNAIMGFADMLHRGWEESPEERREMLATIHSSGRHLMTVINDILDISKIESGKLELTIQRESPHQVLSEVVSLMRVPFQEKDLSLDYTWEGPIPEQISTDGSRLRQILLNLLGNAKKFTPSGGVRLIAKVDPNDAPSRLIVDVVDTGIGIDMNKLEQIFEPFMQADTSVTRRYGGTGLGLSISRRLARMMDGDLVVNSDPGHGSTFRLSIATGDLRDVRFRDSRTAGDLLPRKMDRAADNSAACVAGLRVLVVDDGETNRRMLAAILGRAGASVTQAGNGRDACNIVLGRNEFDVILLDMQMPVMDGYQAARKLRDSGLTLPIIALTAHAMKGDREKCLDAGCSDFLSKPVDADELLSRLSQLREMLVVGGTTVGVGCMGSTSRQCGIESEEAISRAAAPIVSTLPADDEEFAEIIRDFIAAMRSEFERLVEAARGRDLVGTMNAAHWLKGSGGTAGFGCFTIPAGRICEAVRNQAWNDIDRLILTIQDLVARIAVPGVSAAADQHADEVSA